MPRSTRRSKPQLSESWGAFDDDISQSSGDSADDERDISYPALDAIEEDDKTRKGTVRIGSSRTAPRSARTLRNHVDPSIQTFSQRTRQSGRPTPQPTSPEPEFVMPSMHESMESSSTRGLPQPSGARLRRGKKTTEVQESSRKPSRTIRSKQSENMSVMDMMFSIFRDIVAPIISYLLSVFGHALGWLRPFLGLIVAVGLVFLLIQAMYRHLFSLGPLGSISTVIGYTASPCSIPGASYLPLCGPRKQPAAGPVEFDELMNVQSAFEDVLQSTAEGYTLPLAMKHSESSIRDLRTVVKHSNLPSRTSLVFEMNGFIDSSREASADLQKFNSHIGRAVDHIIVANRHTLQVIDGFVDSDSQRGSVSRVMSQYLPFLVSGGLSEAHLLERYLRQTSEVEEQITRLIVEAQSLLKILENLDERLDVIHDLAVRDGMHIKGSRDELFAQLWTKLGGNRNSAAKMSEQLKLLEYVNAHRHKAMDHVASTIVKLQSIHAGLEDLRDRAAEPEILGLDIPLRQHIETIQMGVERLEMQRANTRAEEMDVHRGIMDTTKDGVVGKDRRVDASKR